MIKIQFAEQRRRRKDQFDLRKIGRFSENIDITLHKLTKTPPLRTVCTPYISHLQRFERHRKFICMIGIIPGKRHGQVIA